MKKVNISVFVISLLIIPYLSNTTAITINADDYSLVIYTYDSLLKDPDAHFIEAFSDYKGIPREEINLVRLDDANQIVSQAVLEKDNPVADVLIGLDNVLIHTAKKEGILTPYNSPELVNISTELIENLDSSKYLLPFDYGIIGLWYDINRINSSTNPELIDLSLEDILEYDLDRLLIVEDPTLSSPGLGFLLWTIAVLGDPQLDFKGLLDKDWRSWWKEAKKDVRITSSWGDAFTVYYTPEENRPIMVSYGTSPAYDVCHPEWGVGEGNPPPSKALVTYENGTSNAWLQIEGIGLVNDAPHEGLAKDFIDWFLSTNLQNNITMHNWMYPANINTEISSCFVDNSINPNEVNILNNLIPTSMLRENLDKWKKDWETEVASASSIIPIFLALLISSISISIINVKRKK